MQSRRCRRCKHWYDPCSPAGIAHDSQRGRLVTADDHGAQREARLRLAIKRHLRRYPLAGDTAEGMVASWLPRRGYEDAPLFIDRAVAKMVAAGELVPRDLPDGRTLYVRGPALPVHP